ncbi:hypothetical protein AALC17_20490, partial [Oscillospiraceae bacterium 38-13]
AWSNLFKAKSLLLSNMLAPPDNFNGFGEIWTIEIREERGRRTISQPGEKDFYFLLQNQTGMCIFRKGHSVDSTGFCKIPYNLTL